MNWSHVHLLLNHVPVLGTIFGLALIAWGLWRRDQAIQRVALATFAIAALVAIPVYLTGEPAKEVVEHLAGTAESAIETHEDAGLLALVGVELLGAIALAGIALRRAGAFRVATRMALVLSLLTAGLMARTANLGGRIRHAEIGGTAAQQSEKGDERSEER